MAPKSKLFRIEKNVPLPSSRASYPFRAMVVGDSFTVPVPPGKTIRRMQMRMSSAAHTFCAQGHQDWKFVTRQLPAQNAIRVWRTR